jgi:DNA/RNA endonuclease YhcR with UshA esterase domain
MKIKANQYYALNGAALLLLFLATPLHAHHANSAYDRTELVSVSGTVTRWQFIHPHSGIWIEVVDEHGTVAEWSGEFQGTLDLYRHYRWNKDTFAPGDEITLTGYPARNGANTMSAKIVVFADGKEVDVTTAPD